MGFFSRQKEGLRSHSEQSCDVSKGPGVYGLSGHQLAGAAGGGERRMRLEQLQERP